ncbi:hypothetical protein T261_01674 [Streptomyces lydicus]|nr:hypothetical protein T261_01674 [Streptomyces lydicus]
MRREPGCRGHRYAARTMRVPSEVIVGRTMGGADGAAWEKFRR